jgi:hypothetical protein
MFPAVLSLLLALWAGLLRLPWELPAGEALAPLHGPLMVGGFLGTVIALERAAAIERLWTWLAPLATGLGTLVMLAAMLPEGAATTTVIRAGALLFTLGSLGYLAIFGVIVGRQRSLFNWVMAGGALTFVGGNLLLLLGRPIFQVVPLWALYLVLTITGERLELNRLLTPHRGDRPLFAIALLLLLAGLLPAVAPVAGAVALFGARAWGAGLILMAIWLLWRDIARKTVKLPGVTRYIALCLLSGYGWMLVSGLLSLLHPGLPAGPHYDAVWHSLFVGFVFTMIFGHAPIIVPALTGVLVRFRNHFYLPLILLHASLTLRLYGDLAGAMQARRIGGLINVVTLLLFLVTLLTSLKKMPARRAPARDGE